MGITKFVLKRPVTVIMTLLCLLVFGISSVFHASLEQMPEMETPMMTIMARCEGAGPEDISELVTEPIEDAVSTLEGVKSISSSSSDGSASSCSTGSATKVRGVRKSCEMLVKKTSLACVASSN